MPNKRPPPTLALSAKWNTFPDRFDWIVEHGFGAAYAPDPEAFHTLPAHVDPLLQAGVPVRYHGFFPGYEIGDVNVDAARRAMDVHMAALEAMHGRGDQVITIHIGLQWDAPLDDARAINNLSHLVTRARDLGITICAENLRRGPASDPERVRSWAEQSGAMMTLDVGHAVSSQRVQNGEMTVPDFIDLFADRLVEVHMYERESDRHYPPQDMSVLGPIVDRLLDTPCNWWTLELEDDTEALATRTLLIDYLQQKGQGGQ